MPHPARDKNRCLMKRRLRKKFRLGEFLELGFEVAFQLDSSDGDPRLNTFWDEFIGYVEARGLYCAGASGRDWDVVVYRGNRRAASEEDRADVAQWLSACSDVGNIRIGRLFDLWRAA